MFMLEKWKKGGFVSFISTIVQLVLTMGLWSKKFIEIRNLELSNNNFDVIVSHDFSS